MMKKIFLKHLWRAVFAFVVMFAGGCAGNRLVVNAVELENDADVFQYWDIVIDTMQDSEQMGWADLDSRI